MSSCGDVLRPGGLPLLSGHLLGGRQLPGLEIMLKSISESKWSGQCYNHDQPSTQLLFQRDMEPTTGSRQLNSLFMSKDSLQSNRRQGEN